MSDKRDFTTDAPSGLNTNCLEGMRCPQCGNTEKFHIEVRLIVEMIDDGYDASMPVACEDDWGKSSVCICPCCGKHGTVMQFQILQNILFAMSQVGPGLQGDIRSMMPEVSRPDLDMLQQELNWLHEEGFIKLLPDAGLYAITAAGRKCIG